MFTTIMIVIATLTTGCKKDVTELATQPRTTAAHARMAVNGLDVLHNDAMAAANLHTGFDYSSTPNFLNSVAQFEYSFFTAAEPDFADLNLCGQYADFINPTYLRNKLDSVDGQLIYLNQHNVITAIEKAVLDTVYDAIQSTLSNRMSAADFHATILHLYANHQNTNFVIANAVLILAKGSCQYWLTEGHLPPGAGPQEVAWVALDAAGALVGATIQAVQGGDGRAIIKGAAIGAVAGSLRIVGTIAKGIAAWLGL